MDKRLTKVQVLRLRLAEKMAEAARVQAELAAAEVEAEAGVDLETVVVNSDGELTSR